MLSPLLVGTEALDRIASVNGREAVVTNQGDSFQVRPAVAGDAEGIVEVHFAAVHQTASAFYSAEVLNGWSRPPDEARYEQVRYALDKKHELFLVVEDPIGVVGFGSIEPVSEELRAVYVHPRTARRGVGGAILGGLEHLAASRRCAQLRLDASVNAEAFYAKHGYAVVGRGTHRLPSGHDMGCVRMRKLLLTAAR